MMTTEGTKTKKKIRPSLSTSILIGLVFGVLCGVFFGEYCAGLKVFGEAFIRLLQMSILPYIVLSLVAGIGRLSYGEAKLLATKAGLLLLLFWGLGITTILLMPLAFPSWESASFFSSSELEVKKEIDWLELYIPSNPFRSLANTVIPAVVLFSIAVGIALIGTKDKHNLIHPLSILSSALTRVARFVVYLTPIGVFAISASAAGTMTIAEFGRLQVYLVTFTVAAILLAFWILPVLVSTFTPFTYKDVVGISRDALVTSFTTGNLFIVLPILIENCKDLFEKYKLPHEASESSVDIIIPVSFNFPNIGKLLALLFVLFAAWFYGNPLSVTDYPNLVISGLLSLFGSVNMAVSFLLDSMRIPSDLFKLYFLAGVLNYRFAALLGAMNLLTLTLMATCAITGHLTINVRKLLTFAALTALITAGVIAGTRAFLNLSTDDSYTKDKVLASMQLLQESVPAIVHKTVPTVPRVPVSGESLLKRIRKRGVIRVGYHADRLPFSYFNRQGDLVGFDVDMAHRLAMELGVKLEFIPFKFKTMVQQLRDNHFDIVMSGVPFTTTFLEAITFSNPYMDGTFAVAVKDHRGREFATIENIQRMRGLTIGVALGGHKYFVTKMKRLLPQAKVVKVESIRDFFENRATGVDALAIGAENGAAWSLLYPEYQVVVPKPVVFSQPVGYPIAGRDQQMLNFMNRWIDIKKKDKTIEKGYNYWILGKGAAPKKPRWSIIRNVLHWAD